MLVENVKKEDVLASDGHVRLQLAAPVAVGEDLPAVVSCFGKGGSGLAGARILRGGRSITGANMYSPSLYLFWFPEFEIPLHNHDKAG